MTDSRDVERYVAGTLSDEEAARFEEAMISHPELATDVSVRRRIRAGLSQLEQNQELEALLKPEAARTNFVRYAAAAAVLVVVVAGVMTFWNRESPAPLQALLDSSRIGETPVAASFILATTRSSDEPSFEVQRDGGPVRFQILVDDAAAAPFTVYLAPELAVGDNAIKDSSLAQLTDGFAVVYIEPRALESGNYRLTVKSASGAVQIFPFRLRIIP